MCYHDFDKFNYDEFYTGRDPMEILSDQDFWDWVDCKDLT